MGIRVRAVAAALTSTSLQERCRVPGEEVPVGGLEVWAALAKKRSSGKRKKCQTTLCGLQKMQMVYFEPLHLISMKYIFINAVILNHNVMAASCAVADHLRVPWENPLFASICPKMFFAHLSTPDTCIDGQSNDIIFQEMAEGVSTCTPSHYRINYGLL